MREVARTFEGMARWVRQGQTCMPQAAAAATRGHIQPRSFPLEHPRAPLWVAGVGSLVELVAFLAAPQKAFDWWLPQKVIYAIVGGSKRSRGNPLTP